MADNAFLHCRSKRAQTFAARLDTKTTPPTTQSVGKAILPGTSALPLRLPLSLMQVEFATDVVFHQQAEFQPLYESIIRTAVHAIKADNVATTFLGRKLSTAYQGEIGNDFSTRIQGTRIRHQMGPTSDQTLIKPASWPA